MKKIFKLIIGLVAVSTLLVTSCSKETNKGCMDSLSSNYDPTATQDDGSCSYYYGGREFGQIDVGAQVDLDNEYDIYIDDTLIGRSLYYFPSGLSCGNPQAVGRIVDAGSHLIKAIGNGGSEVRQGFVILDPQECLVVLIENLPIDYNGGGGGGGSAGDLTFWVNQDLGYGNIYVSIASYGSGTISSYYSSNPGCGSTNCANFTGLSYGAYAYSASSDGGATWSGNVQVDGNCNTIQLTTSGGGGGGGSNTGNVTFWTNQDLGCGNIYVTITSYGTGTISSYYSGNPGCGSTGCANFTGLSYGYYSYSATSDGGCTWNGSIQVDNSCETMQFTITNKSTSSSLNEE